jgi:HK97 family phage portal protein
VGREMSKRRKRIQQKREVDKKSPIGVWLTDSETLCCPGYTSLDQNPEIMTACKKIAELIGSLTIHLMANTEMGDKRIINELSRKIDIEPEMHMTRSTWMQSIVMNMLLYGKGNSVVIPHTYNGAIVNLEPISASRVSFEPIGYRDYKVLVDGKAHDPENVLHFVFNPDKTYLWKGRGVTTNLLTVAENLKQAAATEKGFMESKWKPSVIVKVDALVDEFSSPSGREKLLNDYVKSSEVGEPWLIPAEQFQVEQVRPLSLADLAIADTVQLDKKTVASIIGVPAFLLGVGEYNKDEWNNFIQSTIKTLTLGINQELTKKLIISPKMYLRLNHLSLLDWDIETIYRVFAGLSDKGIVTGNEVRDRIGMEQLEGLDELRILENYIPSDMIGAQKKLIQGGEDE